MRLARVNGIDIDIDDSTAIGLTLQSYDVKQPGKRFVNYTNTFNIPDTAKNRAIFGNTGSPYSLSDAMYKKSIFDYWVDNEHLIDGAGVRMESGASGRINLFAFQKPSVWDSIKLVKWPDFVKDFVRWMQTANGLPSKAAPFIGTFADFIAPYTTATEGIKLPYYFGNLFQFVENGAFVEDVNRLWLRYYSSATPKGDGGHFVVYLKTIFEYIEQKYGVNFLTAGGQAIGNLWDDEFAVKIYVPVRDIAIRYKDGGYYFEFDPAPVYLPHKDQKDKADKTLHDCVNGFMQLINVVKDDIRVNNQPAIRLARFDDMEDNALIVDWTNNMAHPVEPLFKPSFDGYARESIIKFSTVFEGGDSLLNSKTLTCGNENLDAKIDLFTIDGYVCGFINVSGGVVPDLSPKESFKTFCYMLDGGLSDSAIEIKTYADGFTHTAYAQLQKAALYSLDGEYQLIDKMLDRPKYYEVERWLTLNDIKNFEFWKLYYIKQLGGAFFVNKISGFNPQKSTQPVKIELIKVTDKFTPVQPFLSVWVDGIGDDWTDGINDVWY
jgi:hypothetical protein